MNEAIEKIAKEYGETSTGIENLAEDIREIVDLTFLMGIKEGWEQSEEGHNNEYTTLSHPGGKSYTDEEVFNKVVKDVFEGLNPEKGKYA